MSRPLSGRTRFSALHLITVFLLAQAASLGVAPAQAHDGTHKLARQAGPGATGGDFVLRSADGPVRLADYRGKVAVLYFGYTFCPDACPTTLAALGETLKSLAAGELAEVRPIFISLDPERDDVKRLKEYAAFFHPSIVGATGTPERVRRVANQYGVLYAKQKVDSAGGYVLDHSSFLYVVDRRGRLAASLPHGAAPKEIALALRQALSSR